MSKSEETQQVYDFGPFRLNATERTLVRDGEPIRLTPKVIDTLLVLVEGKGRIVTKDDLMEAVWPGTFVEESNLASNVSLLRKALGEDADGQPYIETLPKRGYRFIAQVNEVSLADADLIVRRRTTARIVTREEEDDESSGEPEPLDAASVVPQLLGTGSVAALENDQETPVRWRLAIISATGELSGRTFDMLGSQSRYQWAGDGQALLYSLTRNGVTNIWSQPLAGGPPKQVTEFQSDQIFRFAWSRDGKQLVLARGTVVSDVVLISSL